MKTETAGMMEAYESQMQRLLPRNYFLTSVEGGLYIGGVAFVNRQTILPRMVEALGGASWLIALLPLLATAGTFVPQIFMVRRIERLDSMKPFIMGIGLLQRLPYLMAGLALLYLADWRPGLALAAVVFAPLASGLFAGVLMTAWQELVAKTIPGRRLSSVWALRLLISSLIGLGAGHAVARILDVWPGARGYGALHLITFLFIMGSYFLVALVRETDLPPKRAGPPGHWAEFIRSIPAAIRSDRRLGYYLMARFCGNGVLIMMPFLSLHALRTLDRPDSFLGFLLMAQMAGGICGNVMGGWLGDRYGGKCLMAASHAGFVFLCAIAPLAWDEWHFTAIFFLVGAVFTLDRIGVPTLGFEISPERRRVSYLAIMGLMTLAGLFSVSLLNMGIQSLTADFKWVAVPSGLLMSAALYFILRVEEPRRRKTRKEELIKEA